MDSKAEYSALSSTVTWPEKKYKKEETKTPLIQRRLRSVRAVRKKIRVTMEERVCERDEF